MKASDLMAAVTKVVAILEPLDQEEITRVVGAARAALAPIEPPVKRGRPRGSKNAVNRGVTRVEFDGPNRADRVTQASDRAQFETTNAELREK